MVSTVARIYQLVGCSEYIHLIPQILCTWIDIILGCCLLIIHVKDLVQFILKYTCNCIWPSLCRSNIQACIHNIIYDNWQSKLKLVLFLATVQTNKMVILTIYFLQCRTRSYPKELKVLLMRRLKYQQATFEKI